MRFAGNTYANDWYAHLAADGPGDLFAGDLPWDEPEMEPRQRAEHRDWLAKRETALAEPALIAQDES